MRAALIVNPFASNVTDARVEAIAGILDVSVVWLTERRGHAVELAREADADRLYVFSGDGGFNEVLNGARPATELGFIPGGGTSVLPRALGLPRDPMEAARRVSRGVTRRISVGRVNGRRFGFSAGIGLDAELIRRVDTLGRSTEGRRPGDLAFVLTVVSILAAHRFHLRPAIELEGIGRVAFALAANCDPYSYAGPLPLRVAPRARFELGLDVVGPHELRPWSIPRFLGYVLRGRGQDRARDVAYAHDVDRITLRCDGPLPLQADGEDLGDVVEATLEAERDAVSVLV